MWIVDTVTDGRGGTESLGASGKGVWFELRDEQPRRPPKVRKAEGKAARKPGPPASPVPLSLPR
ncbi:hypothetical protein GCM10017771_10430 [Streptomyces capitiformicae]|uniref:Uncharacterized protein n=1 Tax=Streptomyces capitiformicae TaxID=2014920 RepID=A0A919GFI7_9ACTN|nr:hypothetical protein GCM10017771_10430 [Streptomyces capitiformicae]